MLFPFTRSLSALRSLKMQRLEGKVGRHSPSVHGLSCIFCFLSFECESAQYGVPGYILSYCWTNFYS